MEKEFIERKAEKYMLETERLLFKPYSKSYFSDVERLFCKNERVMKSTLKGSVFTPEELNELIKNEFITSEEEHEGFLCLFLKDTHQFVGVSGLLSCHYLEEENYEFGFILYEKYWGKGLATEIGHFWIKFAKENLRCKQIVATVSPTNSASRKVMEKLSMELITQIQTKERGERLVFKRKW